MAILFVLGSALFAVLPVYTPFVVLQEEQVPAFLAGLGVSFSVGTLLALIAGPTLGIAEGGAEGGPLTTLAMAPVAACYSIVPAVLGVALVGLATRTVARLRR